MPVENRHRFSAAILRGTKDDQVASPPQTFCKFVCSFFRNTEIDKRPQQTARGPSGDRSGTRPDQTGQQ
jgi:hypothetical protein